MKLVDYTGMLNTHEKYIEIINKLENICKYIEIVVIDQKESNELVDKFKNDIILTKKVSKWWGTKTTAVNNLYRIKSSSELFKELKKYETFCKYYDSSKEENNIMWDYSEVTDFGYDDIAFYDDNDEYLLFTTTHEGYITISDKLINIE